MACGKLFHGLFSRTNGPFGSNLHIPNNPLNILIVKVYFGTDIYLVALFVLRSVILSVVWHCVYLLLLLLLLLLLYNAVPNNPTVVF